MTFISTSKTEILRGRLVSDKDVQDPYTEKKKQKHKALLRDINQK